MQTGDRATIKKVRLNKDYDTETIHVTGTVVDIHLPAFTVKYDEPSPEGYEYQEFHLDHIPDVVTIKSRPADPHKSIQDLLQQAIPIIQAMATSKPTYNDNSGYLECPYCPATSRTFTEPPLSLEDHHEDCPVRLATAWLEEWRATRS